MSATVNQSVGQMRRVQQLKQRVVEAEMLHAARGTRETRIALKMAKQEHRAALRDWRKMKGTD